MPVLGNAGIQAVYHYTPLHYLPFIGRTESILTKPTLRANGFPANHLRSMSSGQDVARGFGSYAHLTLDRNPRILKAKLAAGFPHIAIVVPVAAVDAVNFSLCRFNVAMTRYLRRDQKPGYPESPTNGRYYDGHQIPIARTDADKRAMLVRHLPAGTMIEVLVHGDLALPNNTVITCFSESDCAIARDALAGVGAPWAVEINVPPVNYPVKCEYVQAVQQFIDQALTDPTWKGNGLEFDRV